MHVGVHLVFGRNLTHARKVLDPSCCLTAELSWASLLVLLQ